MITVTDTGFVATKIAHPIRLRWSVIERLFTVIALGLYSGAFLTLHFASSEGEIDATEGSPLIRIIFIILYLLTILFLLKNLRHVRRVFHENMAWAFILPLSVAWLSLLWSSNPSITVRRDLALTGTALFGIYIAARYSQRQMLQLLARSLAVLAILSTVYVFFLPRYGLDSVTVGAWRGVFLQKNALGRMMAIGVIASLIVASERGTSRANLYWVIASLCFTQVILSRSTGAIVVLFCMIPVWLFYSSRRFGKNLGLLIRAFMLITLSIGLFVLIDQLNPILYFLGKDPSLTGRTQLWAGMIKMIQERPWLGYGYGAFWLGWDGPSARVWESMPVGFRPLHGHNGYLDSLAELGLVGLSIFLCSMLAALRMAHRIAIKQINTIRLWTPIFLSMILVYSVIETVFLTRNNLQWVLFVATVLKLPRRI